MGMDAEIVGIGPYQPHLSQYMEYESMQGVAPGTTVIMTLACVSGTSLSTWLADAFGVGSWDFAKHYNLDIDKVNWPSLEELGQSLGADASPREALEALRKAGWQFHFKPNG
jgi:type IV secretory pathway TrbD component